jgi:hypothetical protein
MTESEINDRINAAILAHERRVGFISGVIGGVWLSLNVSVLLYVLKVSC